MAKKTTPKQFSAYLVTWSDEPSMPVGAVLIDKGALVQRDWNVMNFETDKETGATGQRLARLCPDCRVTHGKVGILGHDGECGSDAVKGEAQQELAHAKKVASPPVTPAPPCRQCGPGYRIGDEGCRHTFPPSASVEEA